MYNHVRLRTSTYATTPAILRATMLVIMPTTMHVGNVHVSLNAKMHVSMHAYNYGKMYVSEHKLLQVC